MQPRPSPEQRLSTALLSKLTAEHPNLVTSSPTLFKNKQGFTCHGVHLDIFVNRTKAREINTVTVSGSMKVQSRSFTNGYVKVSDEEGEARRKQVVSLQPLVVKTQRKPRGQIGKMLIAQI